MDSLTKLWGALVLFEVHKTPTNMIKNLTLHGADAIQKAQMAVSNERLSTLMIEANELAKHDVSVELATDDTYPPQLRAIKNAPPVLFTVGKRELLTQPSVGMCGSRNTSATGLRTAASCGELVAALRLTVVSGYARGVDTQTHLAALNSGGSTVIVLAEGINLFKIKKDFRSENFTLDRVLIVSQFRPTQPWSVGGAMTRNRVIAGLSRALIVIEAGETGGTLNAGLQALEMGRPVVALEFKSVPTPPGNRILIERGAQRVSSKSDLFRVLQEVADPPTTEGTLRFPLDF